MQEQTRSEKCKEWILNHRKFMTIAIISSALILIVIIAILLLKPTDLKLIELLYYTSQIVSAVFVISGVVIAVWQYYLSYVDSRRNIDVLRVQKAVDLSEYYKDNILFYMAPIRYIYNNSDINTIITKIDRHNMKHFDQKKLELYITEDDKQKLKDIQSSDEFFNVVIKANAIYHLGISDDVINTYKHHCNKDEEKNEEYNNNFIEEDTPILSTFFGSLVFRVLNNMEYFALHFTHNVADQSVVYKSLHQTYIDLVQMLYYNIAVKNPLSPSKYYTNVIELYEIWHDRSIEDEDLFADGVRTLSNKGTVVDNK